MITLRRLVVAVTFACCASIAHAQGTQVVIRNSSGTELATSGAPLRTDPTGTTTQPVSVASLPALPANQSVNIAQLAGVTTTMNKGASDAGTQRVSLGDGTQIIGKVGIDQTTPGTTNAVAATNLPTTVDTNTGAAGSSTVRVQIANDIDPCRDQSQTPVFLSINQTTSTQIIGAAGSSKKYYICAFSFVSATAQNIAVVDSTTAGNACATSPSGFDGMGGSTTGTGYNIINAGGGVALGDGGFSIGASHDTNAVMCILQSGAGQVTGGIKYVLK